MLGAFLIAPWLGFSSIANAAQPVCECWSRLGLLAALSPVMGDVTAAGGLCDTIPEGIVEPGEGPIFIAQVIGATRPPDELFLSLSVTPASMTKGTVDILVDADGEGPNGATSDCQMLELGIRDAWACMHSLNATCRELGF